MPNKIQRYFLLGFVFILLNIGLGSWGLTESSEARYAEISREMLESGDYLYPTLMGIRHFHKPPLTYYITTAGYQLFGVNEYGARFFLSLALILQIIFVYKISILLFKEPKIALSAAIIYFSFPLVGISSRVLTTDCYLITLVLGSIYFLLHHKIRGSIFSLYGFYILLGLGFLTKGPAALVPVGLFLLIWKVVQKEKIHITRHTVLSTLLFLLIGGSWFIAIGLDKPSFLEYFIKEQILERAVAANDMNREKSFFYYLPLLPLIGFPWIPFLISRSFLRKKSEAEKQKTPLVLLLTGIGVVLFYSLISSKLILYILPAFPFFALYTAYLLKGISDRESRIYSRILGLLCLALAVFLLIAKLFPRLELHGLPATLLAVALIVSIILIIRYLRGNAYFSMLAISAVFILGVLLTFPIYAGSNPKKIKTLKPIVSFLEDNGINRERGLIIYDFWVPSTAFYLKNEVITIKNGSKRINQEVKFQPDESYKTTYMDLQDPVDQGHIRKVMEREDPIFMVLKKDSLPDLIKARLKRYKNRYDYHKYSLYY